MNYTIGEMAKLLRVAPSTLRYYDKEGLLPFISRNEGGIRIFKESDYELLKIIDCLKSTGMGLKDIKEFIHLVIKGDETIEDRLKLFYKQRDEVTKQIKDLEKTLETVDFKCWYYETAKKYGSTSVPDEMSDDELPESIRKIRNKLRK